MIRGSGVDTDQFAPQALPADDKPIILMPTRLVHNKGVRVFVEAAKIAAKEVDADFQIAGGETKHNPAAISKAEMEEVLYLNRTFNGLVIPFILLHCVSFLFNVESSNVVFFFIQLLHFLSLLILTNFWIDTS